MTRRFGALCALVAALFALAGCEEKADIKKDAMDEQSLKAVENPPPGVPGPPPKANQVPGAPDANAATPGQGR